ncbi:MAG TPA: hypothetical protein VKX49_25500 [Bryobacteraceae bacterium]|nr:hypothetical protein [Bryobacteraceae bacterium]
MKPLIPFLVTVSLLAADAWQTKPFTEWSDKDVQKVLTNSPWAHTVSVSGGPAAGADAGWQGRDTPGSRPAGLDPAAGPGVMAPSDPSDQDVARSRRSSDNAELMSERSLGLTLIWQSALPVKQALARRKYGTEVATSPEAKKYLDDNSAYLIELSGLPPALAQASQGKAALMQRTTLSAKGKSPLRPSNILFGPAGKVLQVVFVFPKTDPFTGDDKDVEFSTQFGGTAVKYKFHLKDMLFHGSLEL